MGMTLVTGGSGFVGSHLVEEMHHRDLSVRGVSQATVPGLSTIPSYGPEADWSNQLENVETVVHLAARVHVMRETASDPLSQFREANVGGTVNLARQAAAAGVRRFIFVSSIKVNGERTEPGKPFTADDPLNPQDPYSISKAEAEAALMILSRETGMEVTIVRPPLVYGPGVKGNFHSLKKWAENGLPSLFAAVHNKRSLVHVANLCDLLITVLNHANAGNQVFLVSDGRDFSTDELIQSLAAKAGRRSLRVPVPPTILRAAGNLVGRTEAIDRLTQSLQIDLQKTNQILNWFPLDTSELDYY
jgi:UDP-glucose 4-epimerase